MKPTFVLALAATFIFTGCAVPTKKEWAATGGSRSDGVVRLSYEEGEFETAQLDESQAIRLATQRCKTWGYTGAEAFGGVTRQCNGGRSALTGGCDRFLVTKEYQCTSNNTPAAPTTIDPRNRSWQPKISSKASTGEALE